MEDAMKRVVKEEKGVDSGGGDHLQGGSHEEIVAKVGSESAYHETQDLKSTSPEDKDSSLTKQVVVATKKEGPAMETDSKSSASGRKDQDDRLKSARAEMGEVREENQRLKMHLDRMMKDYRTLQVKLYGFIQQEQTEKTMNSVENDHQGAIDHEETELVSLSLGRSSSTEPRKYEKNKISSQVNGGDQRVKELSLGLDYKYEASKSDGNPSPLNSCEEAKEEAGGTWPPGKVVKTMPGGDEEVMQQNPAKRARVSVRARCDTPTMNDGCQWRKYGQKIAKGNPCPRAYYRCTVSPSCPVRKQVQRSAEDMSILITTYEGTHNHPLPLSATAMASTTSAAASMLLSGLSPSSSSSSLISQTGTNSLAAHHDLHGLNFYLSDNNSRLKPPFYIHNSSLTSSPSFPTMTLDLTSNPSSSAHYLFNHRPFPASSYTTVPKFNSASLSFGSSSSHDTNNTLSWGNVLLSASQAYNWNQVGSYNVGRPSLLESNNFNNNNTNPCQAYMQKNNNISASSSSLQQSLPTDTIAAATKAITSDPSFQSALAAALTSIMGSGSAAGGGDGGGSRGVACATSYLNRTTSTNGSQQEGGLMFLPTPSLPFSSPRSASASPDDKRDQH